MKRDTVHLLGLTGNIGSGKSTVSARLRDAHGFSVLDADEISRSLLDVDGGCYGKVLAAFGERILREDGTIDRKRLASIVFQDESRRQRLNGIVHPAVIQAMLDQSGVILAKEPYAFVVWDVPLLFECGMESYTDRTVLVYADDAIRLKRVVQRDGCTRAHAQARMDAQQSQDAKRLLADFVLDNSGTLDALYRQVDALADELLIKRNTR